MAESKRPPHRPTDYTEELAKEICEAIADSNKGLFDLCQQNPHWPCPQTIRRWKRKREDFCSMYMQAKMDQIEFMVEECISIADDTSNDTLLRKTSSGDEYEAPNNEWINRSRLRVDTRKWLASKLAPRIYGENLKDPNAKDNNKEQDDINSVKDKYQQDV